MTLQLVNDSVSLKLNIKWEFWDFCLLHTKLYLHENREFSSTGYLQIAKLIEAGSMEMYHLHLNYHIYTKKVTR